MASMERDYSPRREEDMIRNQMFFQHFKQQQQQNPPNGPNFSEIIRSAYPDMQSRYSQAVGYTGAGFTQQPPTMAPSKSIPADNSHLVSMAKAKDINSAQQQAPEQIPQEAVSYNPQDPVIFDPDDDESILGSTVHEKLVNVMQEYSCIWNVNSDGYKDKDRKRRSWEEISRRLGGVEIEYMKKEWEKLRDNFRKCLQRREKKRKEYGPASIKLPTCNFFEQLAFLRAICGKGGKPMSISPPTTPTPPTPQPLKIPALTKDGYREILPNTAEVRQLNEFKQLNKRKADDLKMVVETVMKAKTSRLENDPEASFLLSFVQTLKDLPTHKKQYAKMKISELFYNLSEKEGIMP